MEKMWYLFIIKSANNRPELSLVEANSQTSTDVINDNEYEIDSKKRKRDNDDKKQKEEIPRKEKEVKKEHHKDKNTDKNKQKNLYQIYWQARGKKFKEFDAVYSYSKYNQPKSDHAPPQSQNQPASVSTNVSIPAIPQTVAQSRHN